MKEIRIETTGIRQDLYNTVVTPVILFVPDVMVMRTRVTFVVPMFVKLLFVKAVDTWDITKVSLQHLLKNVCHWTSCIQGGLGFFVVRLGAVLRSS